MMISRGNPNGGYMTIPLLLLLFFASISLWIVSKETFLYYHLVKEENRYVRCHYEAERGLSYMLLKAPHWTEESIPTTYTMKDDDNWPYETTITVTEDKDMNMDPKSVSKGKVYWIKSVAKEKNHHRIVAIGAQIRLAPLEKELSDKLPIESSETISEEGGMNTSKVFNRVIIHVIRRF